jgi:hypothetical protein
MQILLALASLKSELRVETDNLLNNSFTWLILPNPRFTHILRSSSAHQIFLGAFNITNSQKWNLREKVKTRFFNRSPTDYGIRHSMAVESNKVKRVFGDGKYCIFGFAFAKAKAI